MTQNAKTSWPKWNLLSKLPNVTWKTDKCDFTVKSVVDPQTVHGTPPRLAASQTTLITWRFDGGIQRIWLSGARDRQEGWKCPGLSLSLAEEIDMSQFGKKC